MDHSHFYQLLDRYILGEITPDEQQQLNTLLQQPAYAELLDAHMQQRFHTESDMERHVFPEQRILDRLSPPARVHYLRRWSWAAAAAVLLIAGAYFLRQAPSTVTAQTGETIAPGSNGAILILSDGSQIVLDSARNGTIAQQNGADAIVRNGQLIYQTAGTANAAVSFNTMLTPKGRQFRLTLPDGTKVWLNAASSIRYPTAFNGQERKVELAGEAYFEVAKHPSKPFFVHTQGNTGIQVLGTSFNVNAYENEKALSATLLEGSIKVNQVVLKPGQQILIADGRQTVGENADTSKIMAWKNGLFNFNGTRLRAVMRQLERWYNIEIAYEEGVKDIEFYGKLSRNNTLADVLDALKDSDVRFRLEGRKLTVLH